MLSWLPARSVEAAAAAVAQRDATCVGSGETVAATADNGNSIDSPLALFLLEVAVALACACCGVAAFPCETARLCAEGISPRGEGAGDAIETTTATTTATASNEKKQNPWNVRKGKKMAKQNRQQVRKKKGVFFFSLFFPQKKRKKKNRALKRSGNDLPISKLFKVNFFFFFYNEK